MTKNIKEEIKKSENGCRKKINITLDLFMEERNVHEKKE